MQGTSQIGRLGCDTHSPRLAALIARADCKDFDADTLAAARIFLADALAVGVAGRCNPAADGVMDAMAAGAGQGTTRCFGSGGRAFTAFDAAVVNGFLVHCLEWDALHEPSVVIALCATVGALSSEVQRRRATVGELLTAFVVGVETAVFFGSAAASAPRFFRPSTAGVMGAAAAVGKLRGFDADQLRNLLGLAYSQAGGTMQAHWEGSEALALQVGFASRAALTAAELVAHGLTGPHDIVTGKFGYFALFETPGDVDGVLESWGTPWKITAVAHKPFPAGRATQAALTALLDIRAAHEFSADDLVELRADVPSLIGLLVGRPYRADMSPSYARLCLQYVVPRMLIDGTVDPRKFVLEDFADARIAELARRIDCYVDDNPDPNALGPQTLTLRLRDGREITRTVNTPLGAPGRPLTSDQRRDKVARCFAAGGIDADVGAFMTMCETTALDAPAMTLFDAVMG